VKTLNDCDAVYKRRSPRQPRARWLANEQVFFAPEHLVVETLKRRKHA
jgi:hypothetical protein